VEALAIAVPGVIWRTLARSLGRGIAFKLLRR